MGGSLLYLLAGSDEVQDWAVVTTNNEEKEEDTESSGKTNLGYYRSFDEAELEKIKR